MADRIPQMPTAHSAIPDITRVPCTIIPLNVSLSGNFIDLRRDLMGIKEGGGLLAISTKRALVLPHTNKPRQLSSPVSISVSVKSVVSFRRSTRRYSNAHLPGTFTTERGDGVVMAS